MELSLIITSNESVFLRLDPWAVTVRFTVSSGHGVAALNSPQACTRGQETDFVSRGNYYFS